MDNVRRLPVYLVVDCSGSMLGEPIEAVRQGIRACVDDLKQDPQAIETAYLSLITFDSTAQQVVPLTELMQFSEPHLQAGGSTAMGAALTLLLDKIDQEVTKTTATTKGDWKPLVFLLTDGGPTDNWRSAASTLKNRRVGNIIALAAGAGADTSVLKEITEIVLQMNTLNPGDLQKFFKWVTESIKTTSASTGTITSNEPDSGIHLPPPPQGIVIVP